MPTHYPLVSNFMRARYGAALLALLVMSTPLSIRAEEVLDAGDFAQAQTTSQLQTLVAPIALYPDPLLAEILQAATYPDQVSQAALEVQMNPGQSFDSSPWDASVIAVAHYPPVIQMMAKDIPWTTKLGHAYLAQQGPVFQAVQALRQQAKTAGNLTSTPQQQVISSGSNIQIYPADPNLLYLPIYDPLVVYDEPAAWGGDPLIGFGAGWAVGDALAAASVDWAGGSVVNYPPGYGWRNAYSNGSYHAVAGQTWNGTSYAGRSDSTQLANGGELRGYQGAAAGPYGAGGGRGWSYSNGDTTAGAFSRTVATDNGVYTIHGAGGSNGTDSGGYAHITGVNQDGQLVSDTYTDKNGRISSTVNDGGFSNSERADDIFDSHPQSSNLFSEAHNNDWSSAYGDRGAWSRNNFATNDFNGQRFGDGGFGGGGFGGFRGGGGFRR